MHPHSPQNSGLLIYLLLTLTALFFAGAFHAGKVGMDITGPTALIFWRFLTATLILMPFMRRQPRDQFIPRIRDLPLLFLTGFCGIFMYHLLFFQSLEYTSPVNASVLGAFTPLVTSVAAAVWVREKMNLCRLGALFLAISGVLLALTGGDYRVLTEMRFNRGDMLMLSSVFFLAAYNVLSKKVLERYTPLSSLFFSVIAAMLIATPLFLLDFPWKGYPWHSLPLWASILYMGIFSTVGTLFLQMGIRTVGISRSVPFINLVPIFSIVLSALLYGHGSISFIQVISSCVIITGVYLNSRIT